MKAIKTFPYINGLFVAIAGNLEAVEATRKQARKTLEQMQFSITNDRRKNHAGNPSKINR